MKNYNSVYPPEWFLHNIRVPLRLFRGTSDLAADPDDVEYLWSLLVPEVQAFLKPYPAGHATFMWGLDVTPWMTDLYQFLIRDNEFLEQLSFP